jgi:hypothetical protein
MKPNGKAKQGNVIGSTTITIDLGIFKIERTIVDCDGMKDRICYLEKGETTSNNQTSAIILIPSMSLAFGGVYYADPVVTEFNGDGTSTEFTFYKETYFSYQY